MCKNPPPDELHLWFSDDQNSETLMNWSTVSLLKNQSTWAEWIQLFSYMQIMSMRAKYMGGD